MGKIKELLAKEHKEHLKNVAFIKSSAGVIDTIKAIEKEWHEWTTSGYKSMLSSIGFIYWDLTLYLGDNQSAKKQGFQFLEYIFDKYDVEMQFKENDFGRTNKLLIKDMRLELIFSGGKCKRVPKVYYSDVCE